MGPMISRGSRADLTEATEFPPYSLTVLLTVLKYTGLAYSTYLKATRQVNAVTFSQYARKTLEMDQRRV